MDTNKERYTFNDFVEIIKILRSENGCPWDKEQTHKSLRKNLIEESYEFIQEVDNDCRDGMCEELGDVLLQVLLHSQIAADENEFDINDVIDGIAKKMIFRHPHVFGSEKATNVEEALVLFKKSKNEEKKLKRKSEEIAHVSDELPSLMKEYKMWSQLEKMQPECFSGKFEDYMVRAKEELSRLENAYRRSNIEEFEDGMGDVLSYIVAIGHTAKVDSEIALSKNFQKKLSRVRKVEDICEENGQKIDNISSEDFSNYWDKAKSEEK